MATITIDISKDPRVLAFKSIALLEKKIETMSDKEKRELAEKYPEFFKEV